MTESITAEDLAALVAIPEARDFATVTDGGVRGIVGGKTISLGSDRFVDGHAFAARADERRAEGQTVVYAAMSLSSVSVIGNALRRRSQRWA